MIKSLTVGGQFSLQALFPPWRSGCGPENSNPFLILLVPLATAPILWFLLKVTSLTTEQVWLKGFCYEYLETFITHLRNSKGIRDSVPEMEKKTKMHLLF